MKMFRKFKNGLFLDIRRQLSRRIPGKRISFSLVLENVIQPIAVAYIVALAFLFGREGDYGNSFVYFTTLYAFWVGMFGSCQSINGELQNGEWSYWVLGIGRNRLRHVMGMFLSNGLFVTVQLVVFTLGIVIFASIHDHSVFSNSFVKMFVTAESGNASDFYQMNGALHYVLRVQSGQIGPLLGALFFWCLAMFLALLSGMGVGMLFSAVFKEPVISLNIAIGFVVLIGMVSRCGLQGDTAGNDVKRWFANDFSSGRWCETNRLETISRILPQRYFFNVGRLSFEEDGWCGSWKTDFRTNSLSRVTCKLEQDSPWISGGNRNQLLQQYLDSWVCDTNLYAQLEKTASKMEMSQKEKLGISELDAQIDRLKESIEIENDAEKKGGLESQKEILEKMRSDRYEAAETTDDIWREALVKLARNNHSFIDGFGLKTYRRLLCATLWREIAPLLVIFTSCVGLTIGLVYLKGCYHELR